jgi:hypothetical protein
VYSFWAFVPKGMKCCTPLQEYHKGPRGCNVYLVLKKREKKVVGLERGPLSLVSTTEEPLDRKVAAPV